VQTTCVDETIERLSAREYCINQLTKGPVIVYNDNYIDDRVADWVANTVVVDENTDTELLRALHLQKEGAYQLFVISSAFGSRGVDFRCKGVLATLLVMSQFATDRDSYQCLNRVGRFGDAARRCGLKDTGLVSAERKDANTARLLVALKSLKKMQQAKADKANAK